MAITTGLDHEREFARAWADPHNTRGERPPVDVNAVLAVHYRLSKPLAFTKTMLWDMENRKAFRPDIYIPAVVAEGTAETWNLQKYDDGTQTFYRMSSQRQRFDPTTYGLVLEQVRINPDTQKVTFIGAPELADKNGNALHAATTQPLFHVEHGVTGTETQPVNTWKIVHLTPEPNQDLIARFERSKSPYLMEFIEIYIRDVLKIELTRV